jgi:hypothetical protein
MVPRKDASHMDDLELDCYLEELDLKRYAPRAQRGPSEVQPWSERACTLLALTQVWQKIRAEYYPLWLRNLSVRLTIHALPPFMETVLPKYTDLAHAPKLVQICWDHNSNDSKKLDLKCLLLLGSTSPTVCLEFVPYRVVDPEDDLCDSCVKQIDDHAPTWDYPEEHCECFGSEMDYDDWVKLKDQRMSYMGVVQNLVSNQKQAWLHATRKTHIKVYATITPGTNPVSFRIVCKKRFCKDTNNTQTAWDLFKSWGLLDLTRNGDMDFVIACEQQSKVEIDGYQVKNSIVREFTSQDRLAAQSPPRYIQHLALVPASLPLF